MYTSLAPDLSDIAEKFYGITWLYCTPEIEPVFLAGYFSFCLLNSLHNVLSYSVMDEEGEIDPPSQTHSKDLRDRGDVLPSEPSSGVKPKIGKTPEINP